MLNTDVSLSRDLSEDFSVCYLLKNFPALSKCLFINLVWQLKLERYFYESLKFSPSWFALQFLDEAVDSLRFSKPFDIIGQVKELVEAVYCNICRMDFKATSASLQVEQKIILGKLFDHVMSLLRNYNTPNTDDELAKSKRKLRAFLGHSLHHQLKLVHNCFEMFQHKSAFATRAEFHIYKLMSEKEPEVDNFSTTSYSPVVHDALSKLNIALLNTLQNSVMNITLDDFVYWVEIDIDDPSMDDEDLKVDNLQKSIGQLSFALIHLVNDNECFQHDVVKQLQTISIKPKTLSEIAKDATVGTVLDKIESSPNKRVWLEELLSRPDTLYFNTECLQTIIDNVGVVQLKDLLRIISEHQNYGNMDREDELQIKQILRLGGARLSNLELRDLTEELIRTFGVDYNLHIGDEGAFASDLTNYHNKLTESNIDEGNMWKLISVNPSKFFESLLADVATYDKTQIDVVLRILSETNSVAEDFIKSLVLSNLEPAAESLKSLNHIFLAGLFKLNLMDRKQFVRDLLMDNLAKAMTGDKLRMMSMLLGTLRQISGRLRTEDLVAPLTILLAQLLDKYRWDLTSYSQLKETIVESIIDILQDLIKTVLVSGIQRDKDWIRSKVHNCKPMTKFYFQKLSLERGESIAAFDKFLHPDGFDGVAKSKITSFLCENIVRCTAKEFKWLMTNGNLQGVVTDALHVIAVIVTKAGQAGPVNCLHKCVSDYVKVLKVSSQQIITNFFLKLFFPSGFNHSISHRNQPARHALQLCSAAHRKVPVNVLRRADSSVHRRDEIIRGLRELLHPHRRTARL